jgi:hypothetical protein
VRHLAAGRATRQQPVAYTDGLRTGNSVYAAGDAATGEPASHTVRHSTAREPTTVPATAIDALADNAAVQQHSGADADPGGAVVRKHLTKREPRVHRVTRTRPG